MNSFAASLILLAGIVVGIIGSFRVSRLALRALESRDHWPGTDSSVTQTLRRVNSLLGTLILVWATLSYVKLGIDSLLAVTISAIGALAFSPVAKSIPTAAALIVAGPLYALIVPAPHRTAMLRRFIAGTLRALVPGVAIFGGLLGLVGIQHLITANRIELFPTHGPIQTSTTVLFAAALALYLCVFISGYVYCFVGGRKSFGAGSVHPFLPPIASIMIALVGIGESVFGAVSGTDRPYLPLDVRLVVGIGGPSSSLLLALVELALLATGPGRIRVGSTPAP